MLEKRWTLPDAEKTMLFGSELAKHLSSGHLITLRGDLGAGKTTLAKGLIAELTKLDPDDVTSPTFCLCNEYDEGSFLIRHLDAYRLGGSEALIDLGFLDWLSDGDSLILLEWPEKVPDALSEPYLDIFLELDGQGRSIALRALGEPVEAVVRAFEKAWAS
ncbi:MAG: tRNA (adenosine(37)-N6)-threonylcarbamoyltransferase complex ATPase subunit type 1 TsaE [Planctomycetota bacterium]|nr:tRNA (adenosine(37)-N6)-threonylcarbamoyltransferase complex ATPase subunit type 1 TsaE [Planctomycetota bacterium]